MDIRNIGIDSEVQEELAGMVMRKKLAGKRTTIKKEAERAIKKHVKAETKKL